MWDTFALATVLTLKSDPDRPPLVAIHSQSNLKSPQNVATAIFLTHFIISIAVLENVPPDTGLQKPLFHTKRRSVRDLKSNPGHLRGRQSL
jgi:hypothetical protein